MKIAAIQFQPKLGDVVSNVKRHIQLIELAAEHKAGLVYFPELSLTGYTPSKAKPLALELSDSRLDCIQRLSDKHGIAIGVGVPLTADLSIQIGMAWLEPDKPRTSYAKQMLYSGELPYFLAGEKQLIIHTPEKRLAPAICYESMQPKHALQAAALGADVYLASVAKHFGDIKRAMLHYPKTANIHGMFVVMSNCIGPCEGFIAGGKSAAWNTEGHLLAQMGEHSEGFVLLDTIAGCARVVDV